MTDSRCLGRAPSRMDSLDRGAIRWSTASPSREMLEALARRAADACRTLAIGLEVVTRLRS
jgi:ferredoxin